jgi:AraC-like DNA-binding protein
MNTASHPVAATKVSVERACRVAQLIEDSLRESFDMSRITEHVSVSRRQVERDFRRHFGVAPAHYARRLKFEAAATALRAGERIVDVAASHGYADQAHFTRASLMHSGRTPRQLQQAL